ncbi:ribonuclease domain-containing protein [Avibacterium paragallinarum]|uniref:ribonuclease domain-containing protein n=1 Tax=Avibacterium paragallinarum TaxID=728 RepID=UPI00397C25E7
MVIFFNRDKKLPISEGRVWREADLGINNQAGRNKQPGTRLLYSNDGLLFITNDHYESFKDIGKWK